MYTTSDIFQDYDQNCLHFFGTSYFNLILNLIKTNELLKFIEEYKLCNDKNKAGEDLLEIVERLSYRHTFLHNLDAELKQKKDKFHYNIFKNFSIWEN
jgi:hypothetical protein